MEGPLAGMVTRGWMKTASKRSSCTQERGESAKGVFVVLASILWPVFYALGSTSCLESIQRPSVEFLAFSCGHP